MNDCMSASARNWFSRGKNILVGLIPIRGDRVARVLLFESEEFSFIPHGYNSNETTGTNRVDGSIPIHAVSEGLN
jgi:hypothetical protein